MLDTLASPSHAVDDATATASPTAADHFAFHRHPGWLNWDRAVADHTRVLAAHARQIAVPQSEDPDHVLHWEIVSDALRANVEDREARMIASPASDAAALLTKVRALDERARGSDETAIDYSGPMLADLEQLAPAFAALGATARAWA